MSIEKEETATVKTQWGFTNILAMSISMACFIFLFLAAFVLSKSDAKDNTMLIQITTGVLSLLMLIMAYYFGNSSNSARQQQQITEMQKTATVVALNTASNVAAAAATTDVKVDKAVKIAELKAALEKLSPESEEAKKIVAELEQLEKLT